MANNKLEGPPDYTGIRLYKYYFLGIDKPVQIEARTREAARKGLKAVFKSLPAQYQSSRILGESVTIPVLGVSQKKSGGKTFIWVGPKTADGWKEESEYELENKKLNAKIPKDKEILYQHKP